MFWATAQGATKENSALKTSTATTLLLNVGVMVFISSSTVDLLISLSIDPDGACGACSNTYVRTGNFISDVEQNGAPLCEDLARLGVDRTKSLRISALTNLRILGR